MDIYTINNNNSKSESGSSTGSSDIAVNNRTDLFNFIKKQTTSPTIGEIKEDIKNEQTKESLDIIKNEKEAVKTDTKEKNKLKLSDEEQEFVATLIVELLDYGINKLIELSGRQVSELNSRQRGRLVDSWKRVVSLILIRLHPVAIAGVLTVLTYGTKFMFSTKKETSSIRSNVNGNKTITEEKKIEHREPEVKTFNGLINK